MKKTALLLILAFTLSGCSGKVNIDELISAQELPKYTESVDIEISESQDTANSNNEVIVIDE